MGKFDIKKAVFETSFSLGGKFIQDGPQIAMVGRSNVGKSSLINSLCRNSKLARISASPGKTRLINYFRINDSFYLVDLPGYGYARVSGNERRRWGALMEDFFQEPNLFTMGVLIVDSRHAPTADDVTMAEYFFDAGRPFVVVANKCDKLKKSEIEPNLARIRETLALGEGALLIPFSAEKGTGKTELLAAISDGCGR